MAGKVVKQEGFSTHQQALVKYACMANEGDLIVELGCGFYSTPLLDSIAVVKKLRFKCYYQEIEWQKQIAIHCPNTEFIYVKDWNSWKLEENCFVSMLDNEELCVNRYKQINRSLFSKSKFIVIHDADIYPKRGINIKEEFDLDYYDTMVPNTAVIDTSKPKKKLLENVPDVKSPQKDCVKELTPLEPPKLVRSQIEVPVQTDFSNLRTKVPNVVESTDVNLKTAIVCAYSPGGEYDLHYLEYIQRLADGIEQNTTKKQDFFCVTIMDLSSINNVTRIEPKHIWKGWHIKINVFDPEIWKDYDRVLYIDIDTVICGNIDNMLISTSEFSMLHDFYKPNIQETGMIYFNPKITQGLYERYLKRQPSVQIKDADIVNQWLKTQRITPLILQKHYKIGSYKVSLIRDGKSASDYSVICFHGTPRPHHVNWSLTIDERIGLGTNARQNLLKQSNTNMIRDVEPIWEGEDVFIIGGGPSLKDIDLNKYLIDKKVLGINDGYKYECCDICYFGDVVWWKHHNDNIKKFKGLIYTTSGVPDPTLNHLNVIGSGVSSNKNELSFNGNSGMAGINLAIHLGAKRIFLLGFDMRFSDDGNPNWHENIRTVSQNTYKCFLGKEKRLKIDLDNKFPNVEVFNVETIKDWSKMTVFPKVSFDELFIREKQEV